VPDVRGLTRAAARSAIRGAGLVTETRTVPSHETSGTIVAQSPPAGRKVKHGSHVLVNVSRGTPKPQTTTAPQVTTSNLVAVPNVVGQDEASATASLQQAGFTVKSVGSAAADQTQNGVVLAEQPTAGTRAASGATVTITVGRYSATG